VLGRVLSLNFSLLFVWFAAFHAICGFAVFPSSR
jgi:hypothetical protein